MATYPYSPLDLNEPSIRLLHIRKGWWAEDIICQLCEAFADQERGVPYRALSYNWGVLQHKHEAGIPRVIVDGHEIGLTQNLYAALRYIRRPDQDVILWVDAVCINQGDPREKGHQVKQMGNIYKGAEEVLIWLGSGDHDIYSLLESISWIDKKATESVAMGDKGDWTGFCRQFISHRGLNVGSGPKQALARLLTRPWFKRVWILQEVANARTARILCGPSSCPARSFALMPSLMNLAVDQHTQAVLDIMPRVRRQTWWSSDRQLHVLLNKFAGSEALLKRDMIYALLGVSEDACNPATFYPCYEKTNYEVFRDTMSSLLFGEILGSIIPRGLQIPRLPNSRAPNIDLIDLRSPRSLMAVAFLSYHISEGWLDAAGLLLYLTPRYLRDEQISRMLRNKKVDITVGFDTGSDRFVFTITGGSVWRPDAIPVGHRAEIRISPSEPSAETPTTVSDATVPVV
ncbi:heterokaryon incompatibility protein-domain-containing protein [Parachaetomium inaequale]|uniref:Heterokaryon incompatibility protein-domain-containing protein n=1 Tax=Parachaetomium inaequale TaxID=2588326 RepID=A0AAN6PNK9_9PEZI|nr:heterokaryon incompatibility protein-domain-containing protein [Parachaetomium inaequale]